jgi:hypothetical protein
VSFDHFEQVTQGLKGERFCLVIKDGYSGFIAAYPDRKKNTPSVAAALTHFLGNKRKQLGTLHSDGANAFKAMSRYLRCPRRASIPYRHTSNSRQERTMLTVGDGAKTALLRAGLEEVFWPYACRHFCHAYNSTIVTVKHDVPSAIVNGDIATNIPTFGQGVTYVPRPARATADLSATHKEHFAPRAKVGIFLGFFLQPSNTTDGSAYIIPLDVYISTSCPSKLKSSIFRTADWRVMNDTVFPNP